MMSAEIPGVILAGGAARRMGGIDKTGLDLGGRTMLEHVHERLRKQVSSIIINSNEAGNDHLKGFTVKADTVPGRAGPLAGVLTGLEWAADHGYDQIVTVAGDTPFFPENLVDRFVAATGAGGECIALAATRDESILRRHAVFGLWPVALRHDLQHAIKTGTRKVVAWADRHPVTNVEFIVTDIDPFFNVNSPEDLDSARRLLGRLPS